MPKWIKQNVIVEDSWEVLRDTDAEAIAKVQSVLASGGSALVPLSVFQQQPEQFSAFDGCVGIIIPLDAALENVAPEVLGFPILAVDFPAYGEGRGFSLARLLREKYGFAGDLRAIGEIIPDQAQMLVRCGFSSFAVRPADNEARELATALRCLHAFTDAYQANVLDAQPIPWQQRLK